MNSPYYVPSGRVPAQAVVMTVCCVLLVVVPALLYAWFTRHVRAVMFDLLAALMFAAAMGWTAEFVASHGKARSPLWMGRVGLAIGIAGWYTQWAGWLVFAGAGHFTALLADPHDMWRFAMAVAHGKAERGSGMRIWSKVLVTSWILEFIVLSMTPLLRGRAAAERPFCELTDSWTTPFALPCKFAFIQEPTIVVRQLETAPNKILSILKTCTDDHPTRYSSVTLHFGGGDPFISIDNVRIEHYTCHGKNRKNRFETPVITHLRLPDTVARKLLSDSTNIAFPTPTSPASA